MLVALVAALAAFVIGLIDDRVELSALSRVGLLTAVIAAVLVIDPLFVLHTFVFKIFGIAISMTAPDLLAGPFVVLMMLGFVNAANMADGMNGQLLGSVMLWSAFIVHYMGLATGLPYIFLIVSSAVAFIFNLQGKLFTGSSGAYAMSLFVGFGAIATYRLADGAMHAQVPVYWFWLPVIDCVRLMISRVLNGLSPFAADRNHFHHILLEYMRAGRALMVYLVLLAAPGIAAMISEEAASITLLLCIALYGMFIAAKGRRLNIGWFSPASRREQI
jgi:UDP-GlcNAc:undecaprenyl-phosphate GlcNAc-1-phosphate transferase